MAIVNGLQIPRENLLVTYQPGVPGYLTTNTGVNFASDVTVPSQVSLTGPRRTVTAGYGTSYDDFDFTNYSKGPVMEIQNIPGSIYTLNTATTTAYTISMWVKIVSFPTKHNGTRASINSLTNTTRTKRAALARFNYSAGSSSERGYIEFGAMAPYYLDSSNSPTYKSVFSPVSFGAAIVCRKRTYTAYTDYKFNLDTWYLITLQIESDSNFSVLVDQTVTAKIFVNGIQENIAQYQGVAWRITGGNKDTAAEPMQSRRKRGAVAGQPGFINRATGGTISNASSQSFLIKVFLDLTNLNYVSYSPIKIFTNSLNNGFNNGSNDPIIPPGSNLTGYLRGSGINIVQTYIYNTTFNSDIYTRFKPLYS